MFILQLIFVIVFLVILYYTVENISYFYSLWYWWVRSKYLGPKKLKALYYTEYLNSKAWRLRRRIRLFLAGNRCEKCKVHKNNYEGFFDCHHMNYDRFGMERVWGKQKGKNKRDLMILCRSCHSYRPPYN